MSLIINKQTCVVFDLDDTLYKEVEFLKSAYRHISNLLLPFTRIDIYDFMFDLYAKGENTFDIVKEKFSFPYSIKEIVAEYRNHKPSINLPQQTRAVLEEIKSMAGKVGLLTDGRSLSQRNKIEALDLSLFFDDVRISEETGCQKPADDCFTFFERKYQEMEQFIYVGDNIKKDFVTPNKLGWQTLGLVMDESNIHQQDLGIDQIYHPKTWIKNLEEMLDKLKKN